jgi:hypothetical protein
MDNTLKQDLVPNQDSPIFKEWQEFTWPFMAAFSNANQFALCLTNHYIGGCDPRSNNFKKFSKCCLFYNHAFHDDKTILEFKNVDLRLEALSLVLDGTCSFFNDCLTEQCNFVIVKRQ